jgi:Holliday junction resolvasome RuvABC endonuclease subunit
MVIAGIDYSLTSPAICIHEGNEWNYNNCKFYYLVKNEKHVQQIDPFYGYLYPEYKNDIERFYNLSHWAQRIIKKHKVNQVYIEGYAFNAVGRVFQIAENCGLLKYIIWKEKINFEVIAPTMIKKFASGKGNANKELMYESFTNETRVDIREKIGIINNQWNPVSDIADSYYIAKYGLSKINCDNYQA